MSTQKQPTSRQIQAAEMRKKIYNTTVRLYQTTPYEDVTIADICKAAEISTGNFYHYFRSKDDVLNEGFGIMKQEIEEKISEVSLPPVEKFLYGIEVYAEATERKGYRYKSIFLHHELLQLIPYKNNMDRPLNTFFLETLKEAFAENHLVGGDIETLFVHFFRMLKGTTVDWCLNQGSFSLKEELLSETRALFEPYLPK